MWKVSNTNQKTFEGGTPKGYYRQAQLEQKTPNFMLTRYIWYFYPTVFNIPTKDLSPMFHLILRQKQNSEIFLFLCQQYLIKNIESFLVFSFDDFFWFLSSLNI